MFKSDEVIVIDDSDEEKEEKEMDPNKPGPSFINLKKKKDEPITTKEVFDKNIIAYITKDFSTKHKECDVSKQSLDPEVFNKNVVAKLRKDLADAHKNLAASHEENKLLSQSADKYKKLLTELHSKVECPVCFELPESAPIPICPNGHVVCTTCVALTPICPTCRVRMGKGTSTIAVAIIENIPHPCQFQASGCEVTCMLTELKFHIKLCPFRTVTCPNDKCNECVPLPELAEHTLAKCIDKGIFHSSPHVVTLTFETFETDSCTMDGVAFDENIFFLHTIVCKKNITRRKRPKIFYFFVQMIGTEEKCSQYVATTDVFKPFTEAGGLSSKQFTTQICPIDISGLDEAIDGGCYGELDINTMKLLSEEVKLTDGNQKKLQFYINIQLKLQRKTDFEKDVIKKKEEIKGWKTTYPQVTFKRINSDLN